MEKINIYNGEVEEDMSLWRNLLTFTKPRIYLLAFFGYVLYTGYYTVGLKELALLMFLPILTMSYVMICYISAYDHGTFQGRE